MKTNKHNDGGAYQKLHRSELYDDHVMKWCVGYSSFRYIDTSSTP